MKTNNASHRPLRRIGTFLAAASVVVLSLSTATAKPVAEQIKGHWGVDGEAMLAAMKPQLDQADDARRAAMEEQIRKMAELITVEFSDEGKATLGSPEGEKPGTYKMENVNEEAASFKLTVTREGKTGESADARLEGDKLILTPPGVGQDMTFARITKEESDRRKALRKPRGEEPAPNPPKPEPAPDSAPTPEEAPEKAK